MASSILSVVGWKVLNEIKSIEYPIEVLNYFIDSDETHKDEN